MKAWFNTVTPHEDIRRGQLDEAVFAANLAEVADGTGREIYTNPEMFFQKTYFTEGLKIIAQRMVKGLNGGQDATNRVIPLQTGFGGGKTHTLISLYHLAKWGKKALHSPHVAVLLATTGQPQFEAARLAVFTNSTNDPIQGRQVAGLTLRTLWGELAYQLGGEAAYEVVRLNDEKQTAPKGLFKKVLAQCQPALILIDELADYCISASAVKVGDSNLSDQTISFMQELTEAVSGTDRCVLIATLPASAQELTNSDIGTRILSSLESRVGRMASGLQPVKENEIFEVVRRRLFEDLGDITERDEVITEYMNLYQSLQRELPPHATKTEYRDQLRQAYPFQPELIDKFRLGWASNPHFQRTRGVLRILAAIVTDIWRRRPEVGNPYLIHTSDVALMNLDVLTGEITKLYGANWGSVISADVSGMSANARRIDHEIQNLGQHQVAQGVAATILLSTFGTQGQNKGVGLDELKLSMVRPNGLNPNDINSALDQLEGNGHYLYYSSGGRQKRYWFDTTPNINILINQAKSNIKGDDITAEIIKRVADKTKMVSHFTVLVNPLADVIDQKRLTLVILSPIYRATAQQLNPDTQAVIEKLATKKGNSERLYRNTMLYLVCSEQRAGNVLDEVRSYLACFKISDEYRTQLTLEQNNDLRKRIDEASKQVLQALVAAYSLVVKYGVKKGVEILPLVAFKESLDSQINSQLVTALKDEEWLLEAVGLNFLKSNNLLPTSTQAVKIYDIYDAFLRFDDKPMITGKEAVGNSILRFYNQAEYGIAVGDGQQFTQFYFYPDKAPLFDVADATLNYWLVDKSSKPAPPPPPATPIDYGTIGTAAPLPAIHEPITVPQETDSPRPDVPKPLKSITVSGRVALENWNQVFISFIRPLTNNQVEIEVRIKGKSTQAFPLTASSPEYKAVKESASQLGLKFEEE